MQAAVVVGSARWVAYVEEVGGVLAGERDYSQLKGCTNPLVYPGARALPLFLSSSPSLATHLNRVWSCAVCRVVCAVRRRVRVDLQRVALYDGRRYRHQAAQYIFGGL